MKTVLITGASSGFGEACAREYVKQGFKVVMGARSIAKLVKMQLEIDPGGRMYSAPLDVRMKDSIADFFASIPPEFQEIDILINNAGLALGVEPAYEADLEDWENMIDTNIRGLIRITRRVLPQMVRRNSGHIINIGSIAGDWPYPGSNAYGGTKAFVKQFSQGLRADVLGKNIRVSNIAPGLADTNFSNVRLKGDDEKAAQVYENTKPLCAKDVADIIVWASMVPEHVNINTLEVMPTCQAWGPLAIDRNMLNEI